MKVVIDGVEYIPANPVHADSRLEAALETRLDSNEFGSQTIRNYLHRLLSTLWEEKEGFSGKRPFGNSGWCWDLYTPLVKHGFISGDVNKDGDVNNFDRAEANEFVQKLIDAAFYGVEKQN